MKMYLSLFIQSLFGLFNHKYCKHWDAELNEYIDEYKIVDNDSYTIEFENGVQVWIKNEFYAYGYEYGIPDNKRRRPSIKTIIKLHERIKK